MYAQARSSGTDRPPFEKNKQQHHVLWSITKHLNCSYRMINNIAVMLTMSGYVYLIFPNLLGSGTDKLASYKNSNTETQVT